MLAGQRADFVGTYQSHTDAHEQWSRLSSLSVTQSAWCGTLGARFCADNKTKNVRVGRRHVGQAGATRDRQAGCSGKHSTRRSAVFSCAGEELSLQSLDRRARKVSTCSVVDCLRSGHNPQLASLQALHPFWVHEEKNLQKKKLKA
jgi:hypothetical protein